MKRQAFQHPELRDANDNIIQQGTYGKTSPLVNSDNTGVLDYINNNLEALHDIVTGAYLVFDSKDKFPTSGDTAKIYVANDDGKAYKWNGTEYVYMGTESTQLTALDVKKLKEAAADSATAAASSASAATDAKNAAQTYAQQVEATAKAIKEKEILAITDSVQLAISTEDGGLDIIVTTE